MDTTGFIIPKKAEEFRIILDKYAQEIAQLLYFNEEITENIYKEISVGDKLRSWPAIHRPNGKDDFWIESVQYMDNTCYTNVKNLFLYLSNHYESMPTLTAVTEGTCIYYIWLCGSEGKKFIADVVKKIPIVSYRADIFII